MQEPDPERNRDLIAERLGWPEGAADACRALEMQHPGWRVWYIKGGLPWEPEAGYAATDQRVHWRRPERLFAPTAEALSEAIRRTR